MAAGGFYKIAPAEAGDDWVRGIMLLLLFLMKGFCTMNEPQLKELSALLDMFARRYPDRSPESIKETFLTSEIPDCLSIATRKIRRVNFLHHGKGHSLVEFVDDILHPISLDSSSGCGSYQYVAQDSKLLCFWNAVFWLTCLASAYLRQIASKTRCAL